MAPTGGTVPRGFGALWSTVALAMVGFGIVFPVLGIYAERFGAGGFEVGLLVALYSTAQMVAAPLWGRVSDRWGRRRVLVVALVGSAAGSLLTGLAGSLGWLYLGRLVDGASGGTVSVAQATVADLSRPEQRPRLMGLLGSAFALGMVLGPVLGAVAGAWDVRAPFLLAGALELVTAVVAWRRVPDTGGDRPGAAAGGVVEAAGAGPGTTAGWVGAGMAGASGADGARPTLRALVSGPLRRWIAVAFCASLAFSGFEATFSLFGLQRFDFTVSSAAVAFAAIGAGLALVQGVLVGPFVARLGAVRAVRWGLAADAVGLVLLAAASTWIGLAAALAVLVAGHGVFSPALSSHVASIVPAGSVGAGMGTQQSASALARVLGPLVAGAAFARISPGAAYVVGALIAMFAATVLVSAVPRRGSALGR